MENVSGKRISVKGTMFAKYVASLPMERAIAHVFKCLTMGGIDNLAWELWREVHGNNKFKPEEVRGAIEAMIAAL